MTEDSTAALTTSASERALGKEMLRLLGANYSSRMVYAIVAWVRSETGRTIIGNNAWNQHVGPPCPPNAPAAVRGIAHSQKLTGIPGVIGNRYAGPGDQNVGIYGSIAEGLHLSADNLLSGFTRTWTGYDHVVNAARANDPRAFLDNLAKSAWAADHYGTKNGGPNRLITVYREIVHGLGDWYQV